MKKLLAVILALSLILCTSLPLAVSADEEMNVTSAVTPNNIPENPFSGGGTDFEGSDGSKTTVYDNGSMKTEYADGTKQGIDFNGNLYKEDKDGTQTLTEMNGNTHVISPDGTEVHSAPDGTKTTYYPDGTAENIDATGLITKHDENGDIVSMGYKDGEVVEFSDGLPTEGKTVIKGPNGEKLTIEIKDDDEKGTSHVEIKSEGNGKSWNFTLNDDGTTSSINVKDSDGNTSSITESDNGGEMHYESADKKNGFDAAYGGTIESTSISVTDNGEKHNLISSSQNDDGSYDLVIGEPSEEDIRITYRSDGAGGMDSFTMQDKGGFYWHVGTDGQEYREANGNGYKLDANGNPVWYKLNDEKGNSLLSYENGAIRYSDPDDPSKFFTIESDENGNPLVMKTSDGDVVEWKDGAVYKNGEIIKEPKIEEVIDADGDGMPEQVNLTDRGTPMSIENIAGAYTNSGNSYYYGVTSEWEEVWMSAPENTVIEVSITGENTFNILNTATGKNSPIDLTYDPSTGRAHGEYKPEGIRVPAVYDAAFTDMGDGHISLNIITNWGDTPMLDFHGIK